MAAGWSHHYLYHQPAPDEITLGNLATFYKMHFGKDEICPFDREGDGGDRAACEAAYRAGATTITRMSGR